MYARPHQQCWCFYRAKIKFLSIYLSIYLKCMLCTTLNVVLWDCMEILKVDTKQLWNVITFTRYWYLIKRTTNSAGIRVIWINCVLYKVLLTLHIFPVLNIYCTEPYFGLVQRSYVYLGLQRFYTGLRLSCAACLSLQFLLFEYLHCDI